MHVGGLFGRRTSVRCRFDVDLLVFVNGLDARDGERAKELLEHVSRPLLGRLLDTGPYLGLTVSPWLNCCARGRERTCGQVWSAAVVPWL